MERKVFIMIGLPGSGKSTKALEITKDYAPWDFAIHSTDSYFMRDGVYCFNPKLLGVFHERNFQDFQKSLQKNVSCVVVDNTNIRPRDRKPYIEEAKNMGYEVEEVVVGEFTDEAIKLYAARNTHSVPLEAIQKMADRYLAAHKAPKDQFMTNGSES